MSFPQRLLAVVVLVVAVVVAAAVVVVVVAVSVFTNMLRLVFDCCWFVYDAMKSGSNFF